MCSLTLSKTVVRNSPVTSSCHGCLGLVALDSDTPVPVPVLVPVAAPRARSALVPVPVSESCIQDAAMSAAMHTRHPNPQHLFFLSCGNARDLLRYCAGLPLASSTRTLASRCLFVSDGSVVVYRLVHSDTKPCGEQAGLVPAPRLSTLYSGRTPRTISVR